MRKPHVWATLARFTGLVLVSALPLAAAHSTANKGHAAAHATAASKSPAAQPAQPLRAAPMMERTEVSKSTASRDTILSGCRMIQLTRATPVKAGQCIARIETFFEMSVCAELRVTHITQAGIGIADMFGMLTDEQGTKRVVTVRYGETKILGIGFSSKVKVHVEKGSDGTPYATAIFVPTDVTETYTISAGALITGPPALKVISIDSLGVRFVPVFGGSELGLRYGETYRITEEDLHTAIAVKKGFEPEQALLHITHADGVAVADNPSSGAKKPQPKVVRHPARANAGK